VAAHPGVHALRKGRDLHLFEAVDIATAVERRLPDGRAVPTSLVVRGANVLSLREIHGQIRTAQEARLEGMSTAGDARAKRASRLAKLPKALRALVWWRVRRDPAFRKRSLGTVNVTAVGMFAEVGATGWGIPVGSWPLTVTVGTISQVFVPDEAGQPRLADMLNVTLSVDHAVVDGGPITRFAVDLRDMIRDGAGFEGFEAET
jgi:pyruvate/2-oxoglutarate dehydrogenase complex dihydrolipoamide acyltransferase (E2) component